MIIKKIAITTSVMIRVVRLTLGFAVAFIIMSTSFANFAYLQVPTPDPGQAPIPQLNYNDTAKSVAVRLNFTNQGEVNVESIGVSRERAHTHVGNPPLLDVQLLNDTGGLINQFNAWNPLWAFEWESTGGEFPTVHEKILLLPNATASLILPFDKRLVTMKVSDIPENKELLSVDLAPTIRQFCEENPDECVDDIPTRQSATVQLNATITQVDRPDVFGGLINVGDTITGSYTYEP